MNKLTMLWIRACKAKNPHVRIASLYRRFYSNITPPKQVLIAIFADIIQNYDVITITNLLVKLDPNYVFRGDQLYNYIDRCYDTMVSVIRHAPVCKFPELIAPSRFNRPLRFENVPEEEVTRIPTSFVKPRQMKTPESELMGADTQDYPDELNADDLT